MYSNEERLFMVQNIACVHDAAMSIGSGRFDFFEDMKVLKPDVYFVNEDASELEARIQFCKAMNIEVVIYPRKPKEGLVERSSTDMKARMRQYILQEEQNKEQVEKVNDSSGGSGSSGGGGSNSSTTTISSSGGGSKSSTTTISSSGGGSIGGGSSSSSSSNSSSSSSSTSRSGINTDLLVVTKGVDSEDDNDGVDDVSAFHTTFPWRLCFAGGWMDLKWCNELHPGCVVTINIRYHPYICKDRCGLATSSRRTAIRLWNGVFPRYLEAGEAAKFLYGAENFAHFGKSTGDMGEWEQVSYSAGSQDHMGLMFPGITKLNYSGQHWPSSMLNLSDPSDPQQAAVFAWLEAVLWVVEVPLVSRPGGYNSQKVCVCVCMLEPNLTWQ